MPEIQPIKPNYDHSRLVNFPPFITNHPLLEPKERLKREFIEVERERFQKEFMKHKSTNAFIWAWVLAVFTGAVVSVRYMYKKIKAALF